MMQCVDLHRAEIDGTDCMYNAEKSGVFDSKG